MVSDDVLRNTLARMRGNLTIADVRGRRTILGRFVDRVEAEKERARLWYAFPLLAQRVLEFMPPAEFESASPP